MSHRSERFSALYSSCVFIWVSTRLPAVLLILCFGADVALAAIAGPADHATDRRTLHLLTLARAKPLAPGETTPMALHPPLRRNGRPRATTPFAPKPMFKPAPATPLASEPPTLTAGFPALGDTGQSIPPDTHGAASPNHLMTVLNTEVRIQNRSGVALSTVTINAFWADFITTQAFDPKILYDTASDRWIFTAMGDARSANSSALIGVSATKDPTGLWHQYRIDADAQNIAWADYPSLGFNKDWIAVHANMFTVSGNTFQKGKLYVFDKTDLYAGGLGRHTVFSDTYAFTQTPAITFDDMLSTLYLVEQWVPDDDADNVNRFRISTITGPVGTETYTPGAAFVTLSDFWGDEVRNNFAQQNGTGTGIMVNDARIQNTVYRNGTLWLTHTIFLPAGGSSIQWWELKTDGTLLQRGQIDDPPAKLFRAFPSIAVNRHNAVLIGYSRFSANAFAAAVFVFRNADDPLGTFQTETVLKAGEAKYVKTLGGTRNRWGDYSNTVVDPVDDTAFWTIQEYTALPSSGSDRWGTWWGRIVPASAEAEILFDITKIDFEGVEIGQNETVSFAVRNGGGKTLEIDHIATATDAFSTNANGATLVPGDSLILSVSFGSQTPGVYADTLFMTTNTPAASEIRIPLHAKVVRYGDFNLDGDVSILDIIPLVRALIGKDLAPASLSAVFLSADINRDMLLDITDVVHMINIILHISAKPVGDPVSGPVEIRTHTHMLSGGRVAVIASLKTTGAVAALWAEIAHYARVMIPEIIEPIGPTKNMTLDGHVDKGIARIALYSMEGQAFSAGEYPVFQAVFSLIGEEIPISPSLLRDAMASDPTGRRVSIAMFSETVPVPVPVALRLSDNRPNPFNPYRVIAYETPKPTHIAITVYNLLGQEIVRLVDRPHAAGRYTVEWHATDDRGNPVSSGVYIYRLSTGDGRVENRRMTLLR
ncbi:MAG: T9SS type A sorting domain-containing protein [candidate division Zixibacteria bacterium]|nr:T9SS type A sorting domain-containing protein [candidate division Zixibacteria bacterium]